MSTANVKQVVIVALGVALAGVIMDTIPNVPGIKNARKGFGG